ncbi:MAG: hypothetical protein JWN71_2924 [Xanthobacteraceae bacterium]|nr:hypothetical protein [Xanthobacteraceae bacterium]
MTKATAQIHPSAQSKASAGRAPLDFKKPLTLDTKRFGELSFSSRAWTAIVPDGIAYADVLKSTYWKLNARRMSARDTIDVVNDAFTFYAKLLVVSSNPSTDTVEVRELYRRGLAPPNIDEQEINGFAVSWGGGFDKWKVTRASDGHVMKKGIVSREEARYFVQTELTPRLAAGRAS